MPLHFVLEKYIVTFKIKTLRKNGNVYWKKRIMETPSGCEKEALQEIQILLAQGSAINELSISPDPSRRFGTASEEEILEFWDEYYNIFLGKVKFWESLSKAEKLKAIHLTKSNNELWKISGEDGKLMLLGRKK